VKVAFHSGYLGFRGTEVALVDYARGNREILGGESLILLPWRPEADSHPVLQQMRGVAPVHFYRNEEEREAIIKKEKVEFFYCIKNGVYDGVVSSSVPTGIHAIFRESEFHGDVYAYVSPWLSLVMSRGKTPWVPHMVSLGSASGDLRKQLNIPAEAKVFGRHGGEDSFDIPWVHKVIVEMSKKNPSTHFIFLNTRTFPGSVGRGNIHFLPATSDPATKRSFLDACDAMIHARKRGETFGLSCMEFAVLGKKVLTYSESPEKAHLELLGEAVLGYHNATELTTWLSCKRSDYRLPAKVSQELAEHFGPQKVMEKFKEVFLS
jgi:hypothetical protein